jgi:hypothetical protein
MTTPNRWCQDPVSKINKKGILLAMHVTVGARFLLKHQAQHG